MAVGSWWPLLLLGGGSSATTLLMLALMTNDGLLNNLLNWGSSDSGDGASSVTSTNNVVQAEGNIFDVASAEASHGGVTQTTSELLQQELDRQAADSAAANEINLIDAQNQQRELDIQQQNALTDSERARTERIEQVTENAMVGGLGGALVGAGIGVAATGWTGPGVVVGATAGAILGFLGVGGLSEASSGGDWWPFW